MTLLGMTESILKKHANEASAGFLKTFLEPYEQSFKKHWKGKQLNKQLKDEVLKPTLAAYLESLAYKVSEITSIAFSQEKLNLRDIYEPLKVKTPKSYQRNHDKSIDPINIIKRKEKVAIKLIDKAGMGKSTYIKYLISEILFKSKPIPIFYELRRFSVGGSLIDELYSQLGFPWEDFPVDVFHELMKNGAFIVFLDGFDEVQPSAQQNLADEIYTLSSKCLKTSFFITTRPQELQPDLLQSKVVEFREFTDAQVSSLLRKYDALTGLDIGESLIGDLNKVPSSLRNTPLLVTLLYRTYGYNKTIASNSATFYREIFEALYKGHDLLNKQGFGRQKKSGLDFEDFGRLTRAFCLVALLTNKTSFSHESEAIECIRKGAEMASVSPTSFQNFFDDLLVSVPLIVREGNEYFFAHKTIMEFFAAWYVDQMSGKEQFVEKLFKSKSFRLYGVMLEFIHSLDPVVYKKSVTMNFAKDLVNFPTADSEREMLLLSNLFTNKLLIGFWELNDTYTESVKYGNGESHPTVKEHFFREIYQEALLDAVLIDQFANNDEQYVVAVIKIKSYERPFGSSVNYITEEMPIISNLKPKILGDIGGLRVNSWNQITVENRKDFLSVEALFFLLQLEGLTEVDDAKYYTAFTPRAAERLINEVEQLSAQQSALSNLLEWDS